MSLRTDILQAAAALARAHGRGVFSLTRLIVECWRRHPDRFGLAGLERVHPCSNKVTAKVTALVDRGLLAREGARLLRVTPAGQAYAEALAQVRA